MEVYLEAESSKLFKHILLKHELVIPGEHTCICRHTKAEWYLKFCVQKILRGPPCS